MLLDLETVARTHALYILDLERKNKPTRCTNPLEWLEWMQRHPSEVDRTALPNNRELVTVFAGYAGEHRDSRPHVFCTMMKPEPQLPEFAVALNWYPTLEEAREGHRVICERFTAARCESPYNAMMRKRL